MSTNCRRKSSKKAEEGRGFTTGLLMLNRGKVGGGNHKGKNVIINYDDDYSNANHDNDMGEQ